MKEKPKLYKVPCGACGVEMILTEKAFVQTCEGDTTAWCEDCLRSARPRRRRELRHEE